MRQRRYERNRIGLILAPLCALALLCSPATVLIAQTQSGQKEPSPSQPSSNPFPEDTTTVPVMPNNPAALSESEEGAAAEEAAAAIDLPTDDLDPMRSPDDAAATEADASSSSGFSSSRAGMDSLLPDPNAPVSKEKTRRGRRQAQEAPPHQETAAEDITVAKYYFDNHNWRAALSRYQSALVLSPEDPEVYWGLAESQRRLGDFLNARANYQKVVEYDPDSRHGKDAAKALKTPEIANAKAPAAPPK